jgi:hypothetical protein
MAREMILLPKEKYDLMMKSQIAKTDRNKENMHVDEESENSTKTVNLFDILMSTVSKRFKKKAESLWNFLSNQEKNVLTWNHHGELILNGTIIKESNIVDLIQYLYSTQNGEKPTGYAAFIQGLKDIHTPGTLMSNTGHQTSNKTTKQTGKGYIVKRSTRGAPPGLRTIKKEQKTKIKWIKF